MLFTLTLQRGVTSTARHSENITCRGVTSTARHAAHSHSYLDNIGSKFNRTASSLFMKELALLCCGRQLLEFISLFFLCSRNLGFVFAVPTFTDHSMRPSNSEMKQETNVIAILT